MSSTYAGIATIVSAEAMAAHRRVRINASGTVEYADADARGFGTLTATVLTAGDDAAISMFNEPGERTFVASGAIAVGDRFYAAADGKVSATPSGPSVGIARTAASGDGSEFTGYVDAAAVSGGLMHVNAAAGTDHENTTDEAVMNQASRSFPAHTLKAGQVIEVIGALKVTDNNSTDTLTATLRLGTPALSATAVIATAAVDSADGDVVYFHAFITIRSIGATGKFAACGVQANGVPGTVTAKPFVLAETTIDTTVENFLCITADWSVAHADNEVNVEQFIVILH